MAIPSRPPRRAPAVVFVLVLVCIAAVWKLDLHHFEFRQATADLSEYAGRYQKPDWRGLRADLALMWQTVVIGLWGTVVGVGLALATCLFGARNLSPAPWLYRVVREIYSFLRAVPDAVFAVLLVMSFGVGPQVGVIALGLHGIGFMGKMICESLERVDRRTYEGLQAVGATRTQILTYAGFSSVKREIVGYGLYTFDRNIRMAAVLGVFGAGGIGSPLKESIDSFRYGETLTILLVVLATLLVIEALSDRLRRRLE